MDDKSRRTLQLQLQPEGRSVEGSCMNEAGVDRPFRGWIELVAAIDAAIQDDGAGREA